MIAADPIEAKTQFNFMEDIHVIRQNLERLVHHFIGDECSSETSDSDGQCDTPLSGKTQLSFCIRSEKASCSWGPFESRLNAWNYIFEKINKHKNYVCIDSSRANSWVTFEEIGTYRIEPFWNINFF